MILGIDSSDDFLSVGVAADSKIIVSRASESEVKKNFLHRFIVETLDTAGIGLSQIDGVAVAIGPGSFTGLRVGLAAAKGICWPRNLPLAGVSSLLALAACAEQDHDRILAVKDAKKGEFYYAGFEKSGESLKELIPDTVGSEQDIEKFIDDSYLVLGPGVRALQSRIRSGLTIETIAYNNNSVGGEIARIGENYILSGKVIDISSAAPVYVRTPSYAGTGA